MARAYLEQGRRGEYRPRISTWDPAVAELANISDRLGEAINVLIATSGAKPKPIKPRPRPETALDRMERRLRQEQHERLTKHVLGHPPT